VVNPSNGVYTVMVKARAAGTTYSNATYTLVIRATSYLPVTFDGGTAVVTNHTASTWRYYRVDVPTNALGWDIRLAKVTAGLPKMVVARDVLPSALTTDPVEHSGRHRQLAAHQPMGGQRRLDPPQQLGGRTSSLRTTGFSPWAWANRSKPARITSA
jgi:hypothetical protein